MMPLLRADKVAGALSEPDSKHMDVDAIHQGYLRGARRMGSQVVVDAEVTGLSRQNDSWLISTRAGDFSAP